MRRAPWFSQPQHHGVRPDLSGVFVPSVFWMPQMGTRIWVKSPLPPVSEVDGLPTPTASSGLIQQAVPGGLGFNNSSRTGNIYWNRRSVTFGYPFCLGAVFVTRSTGASVAFGT